MIRALALGFALCAAPAMAADTPAQAAEAAAVMLEEASVSLTQADSSRDRVAALTQTIQAYEEGLVALRDGLRRAAIRRATLEADLTSRRDEVAQLLGVLQAMGRAPAPLLLLHPTGATGTARSGMILAEVTPALHAQAESLRLQLEEMSLLGQLQEGAADTLRRGLTGAQDARIALSAAIQNRSPLPRRFSEDPIQTALLIASAETLDAFAQGLLGTTPDDLYGTGPDARNLRGTLPLPVQGQVIRRFNETDAAGVIRPGFVISTRPRALVTAPAAATLRFKGPLLSYGNVVILEPAADVLLIIAGLAEAYGEIGQILPAGAPIGLMGGETPPVDAILTDTAEGGGLRSTETLYLELREGQSPVDPATWFAVE